MKVIGDKKAKKLIKRLHQSFQQIADEYYLFEDFIDIKKGIHTAKRYNKFKVEEICQKYVITNQELYFIIHKVYGEVVGSCEFCGFEFTRFVRREGGFSRINKCGCKGICKWCNKVVTAMNNNGICYTCKPYEDKDNYLDKYLDPWLKIEKKLGYLILHGMLEKISDKELLYELRNCSSNIYYTIEEMIKKIP